MALITCPDCKKKVSESAGSCPKCGCPFSSEIVAKAKKDDQAGQVVALVIVLGIILFSVYKCQPSKSPKSSPQAQTSKWYEGGTLHMAKMSKWSQAPYNNKLATASDLVMGCLRLDGVDLMTVDIDNEIRPMAITLVKELNSANMGGIADNLTVAEVTATIWVVIKNNY